jgi:hypothetical protein
VYSRDYDAGTQSLPSHTHTPHPPPSTTNTSHPPLSSSSSSLLTHAGTQCFLSTLHATTHAHTPSPSSLPTVMQVPSASYPNHGRLLGNWDYCVCSTRYRHILYAIYYCACSTRYRHIVYAALRILTAYTMYTHSMLSTAAYISHSCCLLLHVFLTHAVYCCIRFSR